MLTNIYLTTQQYIPEDSELHTRRRENLKSHIVSLKLTGVSDVRSATIMIVGKTQILNIFNGKGDKTLQLQF
jgi:hypothetical protein